LDYVYNIEFFFLISHSYYTIFNLEITNLLSVVYFTQYVSTIIPPSSMGITKLSHFQLILNQNN
jgi:hypothetical protein